MLQVIIPGTELYDEATNLFTETKAHTLVLEHSLLSVSKWESKWKKPFFSKDPRTKKESADYIRCMTINNNVDDSAYKRIPESVFEEVNAYIEDSMTATTIRGSSRSGRSETITSELIYYWMIALDIPFECQKWHLNRLFTLIQICNIKNGPQKKMSNRQVLEQQKALNASRRKSYNTSG